jgi:DNA-binding LacI/PurR family transcriptional regulator
MARALKGKKSNHILFIADDIQGEYFGKIISEMDIFAYKAGYFITLCADHSDDDFVDFIYSRFFDGIVIGSASFPLQNIQRLINAGIPIVLLEIRDYSTLTGVFGLINTGLYKGAKNCVRCLYEHGRRNLLFLDRINKQGIESSLDDWRLKGFVDQLQEYGLVFSRENVISGCRTEEEMIGKIQSRMTHQNAVPDGIFARNDLLACIGMEAVKALGFSIPKDISFIGFDNSRLSRFSSPALASMEIQQKEIGKAIMRMIIALIDNRSSYSTRIEEHLETQLIMRPSI